MTTALVIGLLATPSSGAAEPFSLPLTKAAPVLLQGGDARDTSNRMQLLKLPSEDGVHVTRPRCASAKRAVAWYRAAYLGWRDKMGAGGHKSSIRAGACPRYLAHLWQRKAHAARVAFTRWHFEQYAWRSWLPEPYRSIFNCETHMNWRHNSGTYQGAPGFHYGTWDAYKPKGYPADAFDATPRQQFIVAQRVAAAVGFGAWGCYR